jgi:hypothetical protein
MHTDQTAVVVETNLVENDIMKIIAKPYCLGEYYDNRLPFSLRSQNNQYFRINPKNVSIQNR